MGTSLLESLQLLLGVLFLHLKQCSLFFSICSDHTNFVFYFLQLIKVYFFQLSLHFLHMDVFLFKFIGYFFMFFQQFIVLLLVLINS